MKAEELIRGLRNELDRIKDKKYDTFEVNYRVMIEDCIRTVEEQQKRIEQLEKSLEIARCGYEG